MATIKDFAFQISPRFCCFIAVEYCLHLSYKRITKPASLHFVWTFLYLFLRDSLMYRSPVELSPLAIKVSAKCANTWRRICGKMR